MKKILGLDLGTNSIGWAVVNAEEIHDDKEDGKVTLKPVSIEAANSRIIPMDASILGDFDRGNSVSQTKERTGFRGARRLRERALLRRERLHRVLDLMGFLPEHYSAKLTRYGKFSDDSEPKLAWRKNDSGEYEFLFKMSFEEMVHEFKQVHPELKSIPYDWTIYYLRKKGLSQALIKEELAWILLNFNQKRGYYQLRGEDDVVDETKEVKFYALKVLKVEDTGEKKNDGSIWYNVHLENGMIYSRASKMPLDWEGKTNEFIVTTDLNEDGTYKKDKEGNVKRSFRAPKEDDWNLLKVKTEADIYDSGKTVGCYIFDSLINNPQQKIIGNLVRTIERKFYKEELRLILEKQKEFISELNDKELYKKCLDELYPKNESHRSNILNRDFTYLFIDDILFYQRPLKSKKSLIANCPYESYEYKKKDKNGEKSSSVQTIKCIAKSHPLFQEFRLLQFVRNLKIYQREMEVNGKLCTDVDVTSDFFKSEDDVVALFDWLNDRAFIKQDTLFSTYFKLKKRKGETSFPYRWNYVEDKEYPCNETRELILKGLSKLDIKQDFLSKEKELELWHILYSIEDKFEIGKALVKYAEKNDLPSSFAEEFAKLKPFKKEYGSYSAKAIKKLLPLMRMGKYWSVDDIDERTKGRIEKLITGEYDENISDRVREKVKDLSDISQFRGLSLWMACYVVYNRHSEAKDVVKWERPEDIDAYLKTFKQHSMRNPIVEQVVTETLRTVRDIWKQVGRIDEIHLELGREMKNPADKRKRITDKILENEKTNLRIKAMLMEFMNPEMGVENVRPYSPSQQDIFRIYEEYALNSNEKYNKDIDDFIEDTEIPDYVTKVVSGLGSSDSKKQPSKNDIKKYKCWLEQRYRSPYTGKMIPLAKLFTSAYEIEHIIPQSRYFDDSFSNKVICEAEVNKLKDNKLGYEFIQKHHGEKVQLSGGGTVDIFSVAEYVDFVKNHFSGSKKKLLMTDIPDGFIERQLNDSRYISKFIKGLLSNIVRAKIGEGEYEQEAVSKNLISCTGGVTDRLKKDWGMDDVWNRIVFPRFERLNKLTGSDNFTTVNRQGHPIPDMPLELQKGFNKKRIDHRHHAMDAIVIACATRSHVNYLNNESAKSDVKISRNDLKHLLCTKKVDEEGNYKWIVDKPWKTFTSDAQSSIENMIVSFKQNLRVINKTTNRIEHYDENGKKTLVKQCKGDSWAIRKSMHKDTVYGEVNLRRIKEIKLSDAIKNPQTIVDKEIKKKIFTFIQNDTKEKEIVKYFSDNKDVWSEVASGKVKVYYYTKDTKDRFFAVRKPLDSSFTEKKIKDEVTDTGVQKILLNHLEANEKNAEIAFSPDGIDRMNRNIIELNEGKFHQPIYKVRVYEKADKFAIGSKGNKSKKFVEAAKGTNLFFVVYSIEKEDKKSKTKQAVRTYATAPLEMVINCQKKNPKDWKAELDSVLKEKEYVDKEAKLLFILSPNDLVYLPTKEELKNGVGEVDKKRIYKIVSFTVVRLYAVPFIMAKTIVDKVEYSQLNKVEFTDEKESIKEICQPICIDRLGNIISLGY
jgi:CRISPR-associated endonuclease Csn1